MNFRASSTILGISFALLVAANHFLERLVPTPVAVTVILTLIATVAITIPITIAAFEQRIMAGPTKPQPPQS